MYCFNFCTFTRQLAVNLLDIKPLYLVFPLFLYEWSIFLSVMINLNSSIVIH